MTGFKDGAVGWDDDENDDDKVDEPMQASEETTDSTNDSSILDTDMTSSTKSNPTPSRLPWIHARSSITDGRQKTVQLHLQESTIEKEREGLSEVQRLLDENIKKADFREAALLVGLIHLDELSEQLREWGYNY